MTRASERPLARGREANAGFRRLAAARRPVLFLDLDGTLAPLVRRPAAARVPRTTRKQLARLRASGAVVVIVSGRSTSSAATIAAGGGEFSAASGAIAEAIIGNHGADLLRSGILVRWASAGRISPTAYRDAIAAAVARWPGAWLETKEHSLAVHYREAPRAEQSLLRAVRAAIAGGPLEVRRGNRVLDVRSRGVHKGAAVRRWLAKIEGGRIPLEEVLYAGDDTTDEDAFRALGRRAVTIAVGRRTRGARFRTRSPETFATWLRRLADARGARPGRTMSPRIAEHGGRG
jgi:trehalose-phosphatase